jgi:hypothetical protein
MSQLLVILDEGDNSPIPLTGAKLLLPAYRLRFFRERGASLSLAYGRADLDAPRYDLALLAPQTAGRAAVEVAPAPRTARAATSGGELVSPRLFWSVLAIAVLVLLGMIVRLARDGSGHLDVNAKGYDFDLVPPACFARYSASSATLSSRSASSMSHVAATPGSSSLRPRFATAMAASRCRCGNAPRARRRCAGRNRARR